MRGRAFAIALILTSFLMGCSRQDYSYDGVAPLGVKHVPDGFISLQEASTAYEGVLRIVFFES